MPYVERDASGLISAIFQKPEENATELLPHDHPDIQIFLGGILPQNNQGQRAPIRVDHGNGFHCVSESGEPTRCANWVPDSDVALIRVIEDIIDTLIEKNLIMFTDLPPAARSKIMSRKSARENFGNLADLREDDDKIF